MIYTSIILSISWLFFDCPLLVFCFGVCSYKSCVLPQFFSNPYLLPVTTWWSCSSADSLLGTQDQLESGQQLPYIPFLSIFCSRIGERPWMSEVSNKFVRSFQHCSKRKGSSKFYEKTTFSTCMKNKTYIVRFLLCTFFQCHIKVFTWYKILIPFLASLLRKIWS